MSVKKIVTIVVVTVVSTLAILLGFLALIRHNSQEWPNTIEQLYTENKETLNEFVNLCFDNQIDYIGSSEYIGKENREYTIINDYYIYYDRKPDDGIIDNLSKYFILFKQYKVHDIYINESGILFGTGSWTYNASLVYTIKEESIDKIKTINFYDKVWYIDDHWYIGVE